MNGNAYPGTLREGPAEKRVGVASKCHSSFGCFPKDIGTMWLPRSDPKLGMALERHSPYLCMIERP